MMKRLLLPVHRSLILAVTTLCLISYQGNGQMIKTFAGHEGDVLSVAFSPDGNFLATGSGDRTIKIWNIQNGELVKTLKHHSDGVRSVQFSSTGNYLASGSWDKTALLWNIKTANVVRIFTGHSEQIYSVAFSPDGKHLATASADNSVRIWDMQKNETVHLFKHTNRAFSAAFSPDGKYVATGSDDPTVRIWSLTTGKLTQSFSGHTSGIITVAFSPDGRYLASGSSDNTVRIWDLSAGSIVKILSGHSRLISSISFAPDGKHLVSGSFDNTIRLWDLRQGTLLKTLSINENAILSVAFSPDGKMIASGSSDKTATLWNVSDYLSEKSDPKSPPLLAVKENSITFFDTNGNERLDAGEIATVEFVLTNKGKGTGRGLAVVPKLSGNTDDISFVVPEVMPLEAGKEETITTIVKAGMRVRTGKAVIKLTVTEPNGLDADPVEVAFNTLSFQPPKVVAVDGIFSSEAGGKLKTNYPANLEIMVQNTGLGNAEEITAEVVLPDNVLSLDPDYLPIVRLNPGESVRVNTAFIVTARYSNQDVPIRIILKEKNGVYGSEKIFVAKLDQPLATTRINVQGEAFKSRPIVVASLHSDVDKDIPENPDQHSNRFALVIGNEDYQRFQKGLQTEQNVVFARNDALIFKEYLVHELGFPENQVFVLTDATRGQMGRELERLVELAKLTPKAELVFYYAGHGLPDEETKQAYIIPVDVTASSLHEGILLNDLYKKLASANAARVTVFLDACFSGGGRGENGLLASRTVKIKPKGDLVEGNVVVFTAASGEQVSLPLERESHGLFTYYLLRKLKDTKGNITMDELRDYLQTEVPKESLLENSQQQSPQVLTSPELGDQWLHWKW